MDSDISGIMDKRLIRRVVLVILFCVVCYFLIGTARCDPDYKTDEQCNDLCNGAGGCHNKSACNGQGCCWEYSDNSQGGFCMGSNCNQECPEPYCGSECCTGPMTCCGNNRCCKPNQWCAPSLGMCISCSQGEIGCGQECCDPASEHCENDQCVLGTTTTTTQICNPPNCNDNNACTTDTCTTQGCTHTEKTCPPEKYCNPANGNCDCKPYNTPCDATIPCGTGCYAPYRQCCINGFVINQNGDCGGGRKCIAHACDSYASCQLGQCGGNIICDEIGDESTCKNTKYCSNCDKTHCENGGFCAKSFPYNYNCDPLTDYPPSWCNVEGCYWYNCTRDTPCTWTPV